MLPVRNLVVFVCIAAGLSGCGDPRDVFVGTYRGTGGTTARFANGTTDYYAWGDVTASITAPDKTDTLDLGDRCGMQGKVTGQFTFEVQPKVCQRERFDLSGGGFCYSQNVMTGGTGVLTGDTLSMNYTSTLTISDCSDGSAAFATNDTHSMTVTR